MLKHVWSVICGKSSIDKETNNVSLFDVLEQLSFAASGQDIEQVKETARKDHVVVPFNFEVTSLWERSDVGVDLTVETEITVVDPNNKRLQSFSNTLTFPVGKRRMRVANRISGMPVTESGIYHVVVALKEKEGENYKPYAEIPLEIAVTFG